MPVTQTFRTSARRYELIRPIYEGPIATVWRARDVLGDNEVVVKQLNGASAEDPIARTRLQEEALATQRVSHPGAVPVIDTIFSTRRAALVFPYVPGRTLAERLRDDAPVAEREAARIALDLADVLAAAHAAGIVHRDVKPGNVLLGDDGRVRLLDFGIARTELPLELTGSGTAIGTLPYMAPEQLTGSNPAPSADVFALGVVTYEMLAGARPFNGNSPVEQLNEQRTPRAPLEVAAPLAALVAAMLNPLPGERPSAEQVGRALRGWLDGRTDAEAVTAAVATVAPIEPIVVTPRNSNVPRLAGVGLGAAIVLLAGAVTLLGLGSQPAAVNPTDQPSNAAVAVAPTAEPTPARTAAPRADAAPPADAAPANQPTATRSNPGAGPSQAKPPKAEHKNKKHGAANGQNKHPSDKNKKPKKRR
jgi:serine/threonine protein kinase